MILLGLALVMIGRTTGSGWTMVIVSGLVGALGAAAVLATGIGKALVTRRAEVAAALDQEPLLLGAAAALTVLVLITMLGWYPVAMVGVTGQARSNSLPPTLALALLAATQVGVLFAVAEPLRRRLSSPRWYLPVAVAGSRATIE
ncbi:MAG: hypothetical protein KY395_08025 [Actinobacteria bacterium]|nr:hypothetical protein [Actinomycetota bacterium]